MKKLRRSIKTKKGTRTLNQYLKDLNEFNTDMNKKRIECKIIKLLTDLNISDKDIQENSWQIRDALYEMPDLAHSAYCVAAERIESIYDEIENEAIGLLDDAAKLAITKTWNKYLGYDFGTRRK